MKGRKRHLIVDTLGLIVALRVHAADIQDREGAKVLLMKAKKSLRRLEAVLGDGAYGGKLEEWVDQALEWNLMIARKEKNTKGFQVIPFRWIVERTLGWLNRYRRLSKDYEALASTTETMIYWAMINLMLHRLAPE